MPRLLLDENLPRRLARLLIGHEVRTVGEMRWSGLQNGALLGRAAVEFDALLTCDQSLPNQQHIATLDIAVLVLRSRSNKLADLAPLVPDALVALQDIRPGEVRLVHPPADPADSVIP